MKRSPSTSSANNLTTSLCSGSSSTWKPTWWKSLTSLTRFLRLPRHFKQLWILWQKELATWSGISITNARTSLLWTRWWWCTFQWHTRSQTHTNSSKKSMSDSIWLVLSVKQTGKPSVLPYNWTVSTRENFAWRWKRRFLLSKSPNMPSLLPLPSRRPPSLLRVTAANSSSSSVMSRLKTSDNSSKKKPLSSLGKSHKTNPFNSFEFTLLSDLFR